MMWLAGTSLALWAFLANRVAAGAVGVLMAVAALGALRAAPEPLPANHIARLTLPAQARVVGRLAAAPQPLPGRSRLLLDVEEVDGERRRGRLSLTAYGQM